MPGSIEPENLVTSDETVLQVISDANQDYVKAYDRRNEANKYVMYFEKSPRYGGEIHCEAYTGNERAEQLCKSYGPIATVAGTDNDYTAYVLKGSGIDAGVLRSCGNDC